MVLHHYNTFEKTELTNRITNDTVSLQDLSATISEKIRNVPGKIIDVVSGLKITGLRTALMRSLGTKNVICYT